MRSKIVAANWKMNGTKAFARSLISDLKAALEPVDYGAEIVIIPPALLVTEVAAMLGGTAWKLGVQNVARWASGAYTGEVSAAMAADAGASYAICGHSERRHLFGESSTVVAEKVGQVLAAGLSAIVCVGETLDQREAGEAYRVVDDQLRQSLQAVDADQWQRIVVAYEPVWAIGTGRTASCADAQKVHADIRSTLNQLGAPGDQVAVLYGGSVKPDNAAELLAQADIDGSLVGGASLDAQAFSAICRA